jgi:hypothetical protein
MLATYFIRQTLDLDIDDATRRKLWESRKIAVHYPWDKSGNKDKDSTSTNPDDYVGPNKRPIRALRALGDSGGYVCAQHYLYTDCMLGFVEPHTEIELLEGRWGKKWNMEGRPAVLKALQLTKIKLVSPLDHAVLLVGRPRRGTLMRWHRAGKTIENLVEGRTTNPSLSDLFTDQQEIMCSEFLRLPQAAILELPTLAHLLLPPGGTMKDIDILGLATDGKMLLAQVTFDPLEKAAWKLERLVPYKDPQKAHLVLFCACKQPTVRDGVIVFPIQQAYDTLTASSLGLAWLQRS